MLRVLVGLLLVFSFLPYIQIIPLGTDTQPNALFFASIITLITLKRKIPGVFGVLLFIAITAICILLFSPLTFSSIRSCINYIGLFIIPYAVYNGLLRIDGVPYKLFRTIVYIWFIVGTVQLFIDSSFCSFLLPRGDSEATLLSGRGIVCLAPEPTFYGLTCILLGIIAYINFKDKEGVKLIYFLLLVQLIIYSRSTLAIFALFGSVMCYYLISFIFTGRLFRSITIITLLAIAFLAVYNYAESFLSEYRVGKLFLVLLENPTMFILLDDSVNERFIHVFFPIYGFIENYMIPHGFGGYSEFLSRVFSMSEFNDLYTLYSYESFLRNIKTIRIMSGLGAILYELGFIGIIFIYYLHKLIKRSFTRKEYLFLFVLFMAIMLNAMPFANPMVAFLIGNIIYINKIRQQDINENNCILSSTIPSN